MAVDLVAAVDGGNLAQLNAYLARWGMDAVYGDNNTEIRVVLDRHPAEDGRVRGWTAQAGCLSEETRNISIGETLNCGSIGEFTVESIDHDGHGWSVMQLGAV